MVEHSRGLERDHHPLTPIQLLVIFAANPSVLRDLRIYLTAVKIGPPASASFPSRQGSQASIPGIPSNKKTSPGNLSAHSPRDCRLSIARLDGIEILRERKLSFSSRGKGFLERNFYDNIYICICCFTTFTERKKDRATRISRYFSITNTGESRRKIEGKGNISRLAAHHTYFTWKIIKRRWTASRLGPASLIIN